MRPKILKIAGLNSFIEEEVIDFTRLTGKGLFGIFGPTGSGKSSILDAITMALYGRISRGTTEFINTECNELYVYFEFKMCWKERNIYRVERKIKQKEDGGYLTTLCRLVCKENGRERIYDKVGEVNEAIEEIIGLNHDDFVRSIVLPQGKFSEFLKLKNKPRRDMLERILGLEEFGKTLLEKIKEAQDRRKSRITNLDGALSKYEDVAEEKLNADKELLNELEEKLKEVKEKLKETAEKYEEYRDIWKAQQSLNEYGKKREKLAEREDEIAKKEKKLDKGKKAKAIKPFLLRYEQDTEDREALLKQRASLGQEIDDLEIKVKQLDEEYAEVIEEKERQIPKLARIIGEIGEARKLREVNQGIVDSLNKKESELKDCTEQLESLRKDENELKNNLDIMKKVLKEKEDMITRLKIPSELRKIVVQGREIERSYQEKEKILEELFTRKEDIRKKIDTTEDELEEKENKLKDLEGNIAEYKGRLKVLVQNSPKDEETIYKEKAALDKMKRVREDYLKNREKYLEAEKNLREKVAAGAELERQLKEVQQKLHPAEEKYEELAAEIRQIERQNLAAILARDLEDEKPCPVCGSTHHPLPAGQPDENLDGLEQQKKELEEEIDRLKNKKSKLETELRVINNDIERYQGEKRDYQKEINGIEYEELEKEIAELEKSIFSETTRLKEWKEKKEELEDKLKVLDKDRQDITGEIIRLKESHKKDRESLQEVNEEIDRIGGDFADLEKKYLLLKEEAGIEDFAVKSSEIEKDDQQSEKLERELKDLQAGREELITKLEEKREEINKLTRDIEILKQKIKTDKERLAENEDMIKEKIGEKDPDDYLKEIEEKKKALLSAEKKKKEKLEETKNDLAGKKEERTGIFKTLEKLEKGIRETEKYLKEKIEEYGFSSIAAAREYLLADDELESLQQELDQFNDEKKEVMVNINRIKGELNGRSITEKEWRELEETKTHLEKQQTELIGNVAAKGESIKKMQDDLKKKKALTGEKEVLEHELALIKDIYDLVGANKFVEFVAIRQLQYIVREASKRLMEITNNRYQLELDSQGEFVICDNYNGGVRRDCNTLSGGETFLTSLSLALALSSQIQLKRSSNMEFFFLDEGFGTLDANLLDIVMSSLEQLRQENLIVGIISHVEELKDRVPVKLMVKPAEAGVHGTRVQIEYS